MSFLYYLNEASRRSALKVQQELIDALPHDFDVDIERDPSVNPFLKVKRGNADIDIFWHGDGTNFIITRNWEVSDNGYGTITSLKELVIILMNELER